MFPSGSQVFPSHILIKMCEVAKCFQVQVFEHIIKCILMGTLNVVLILYFHTINVINVQLPYNQRTIDVQLTYKKRTLTYN